MTAVRIAVPPLFDGDWDSVVICSYGADLSFFERDLWRQLHRTKNRIIFADRGQIERRLRTASELNRPRYLNRSYVLAPISSDHAAHAKLILLLAADHGLLAIGSGNLSFSGYASQAECFTTYRWSEDDDDDIDLPAFVAVRRFLDRLIERKAVETVIGPRLQQAWSNAPWIYRDAGESSNVRHNLDRSHLDQMIEVIGGRRVKELVVHAPFYDHRCTAIRTLIETVNPDRIRVLLQERLTSVDPKRLKAILESSSAKIDVRSVSAEESGAVLHAKFIIARCGKTEVCLQGSPNLSTPALLEVHPNGNIELANLLTGEQGAFDHLVNDLVMSESVDLASLDLALADSEDGDQLEVTSVTEFVWVPPSLRGVFGLVVRDPPELLLGEQIIEGVRWSLEPQIGSTTMFTAVLPDECLSRLDVVEALTFRFADAPPSGPCFPLHLNVLNALAQGHGRAELLKHAGDFAVGDEELTDLLAQLEEVLIVDGTSLWRLVKRSLPSSDDVEGSVISYDALDWDAIQSHPKLAQYRYSVNQRVALEPTNLGVLLSSISGRFRDELALRRGEVPGVPLHPVDIDPGLENLDPIVEDEDAADDEGEVTERRRLSARSRARRQFQSFVKRVAKGLTDEKFVAYVGSSVVIPSYVVFNHLCWKLLQLDLADPITVVRSQAILWHFFWGAGGDSGYVEGLSKPEQEAALQLLDEHHSEAVLLCSLVEAIGVVAHEGTEADLLDTRDAWRSVLNNKLWQPTKAALEDAVTLLNPVVTSVTDLVETLDGWAYVLGTNEPREVVATALGIPVSSVATTNGLVTRGVLGVREVDIYLIEDEVPRLDSDSVSSAFATLRGLLPEGEGDYLRIEQPLVDTIAFADYETSDFVLAERSSGTIVDLAAPEPTEPSWGPGIDLLYELAS